MNKPRFLRKAVSDVSSDIGKYIALESSSSCCWDVDDQESVLKQAECECCGLKEDCTADYIRSVEGCYCGKWVCGLCSEAVKERVNRSPMTVTLQDAVKFHKEFCQKFNTTTRLNPKLSLTCSMRNIAKRSSLNRSSNNNLSATRIARSTSCVPNINFKH